MQLTLCAEIRVELDIAWGPRSMAGPVQWQLLLC